MTIEPMSAHILGHKFGPFRSQQAQARKEHHIHTRPTPILLCNFERNFISSVWKVPLMDVPWCPLPSPKTAPRQVQPRLDLRHRFCEAHDRHRCILRSKTSLRSVFCSGGTLWFFPILHHTLLVATFATPTVGLRSASLQAHRCCHGDTSRTSCEDHHVATTFLETSESTTFALRIQEDDELRLCKRRTSSAVSHHGQCSGASTHCAHFHRGCRWCAQPSSLLLLQCGGARSTARGGGTVHA
mmetsp:Transcript_9774/g.59432  ORF Transcript_9774/g.59432 Transcript_9774/m.59432 type:complete len:242 (+) Transcript_9774:1629-2354(+)